MTLLQKLKDQGWHLTEEGLKKLTTDLQTEDVKKIITAALDLDIKDIAAGALPDKPDSNGHIAGRIVLQMQKMRNISAPKANEESTTAPRFFQLELSDGVNSIVALELERIRDLNLNIPPGTKLYLKGDKLQLIQGLLVLKESEVQILGGKVEHMMEKWELARQLQKYARSNRRLSGSGSGPPPWIAFGKRLDAHKDALPQDRNFKSLQAATEKDKNSKENDEFNTSRSQAIAEALKAGQKRIFGGGQQNILDHNVKKILEKGYSEEEAKYALKTTNNNLERALYNLKRRNNRAESESLSKPYTAPTGGIQRGRGVASAKEEATASKPQTNVSLFDFLTDKLPATVTTSNTTQSQPQVAAYTSQNTRNSKEISKTYNSNSKAASYGAGKFENNMSSSFAANRAVTTRPEDKQTQSQPQSQRSSYNQKEERKTANPFRQQAGGRGGERTRSNVQSNEKPPTQATSNDEVTAPSSGSNNNNNNATQSTTYGTNSNRRNDRNDRPPRKEREQTPRLGTAGATGGGYQGNNKRSQDYKSNDNKSYQPRESNSRTTNENRNGSSYQQQTQQPKANNIENTIDKLVESTSKMSIQNKKEPYNNSQSRGRHQAASARSSNPSHNQQNVSQTKSSNSNQQQSGQFIGSQNFTNKAQPPSQQVVAAPNPQQQQKQQQQPQAYVTQLPNGFSYDPSKIMGFQSKEANEYAMNLLKSQGLLPQQSPAASQTQVPPPTPQQHTQPQIISNPQAPPPPPAVTYMTQNSNVFVAPPQQQAQMAQYGMMSGGGNWPWNIGDLCLAKYWEDGSYYNAKITAVSENTCVVLYLGYGNHEEVVRTDCLPITDAQHHPINAYQAGGPQSALGPMQQLPHNFQGGNATGGGGNQRYHRSERQMYVPPPKRGNNNN